MTLYVALHVKPQSTDAYGPWREIESATEWAMTLAKKINTNIDQFVEVVELKPMTREEPFDG